MSGCLPGQHRASEPLKRRLAAIVFADVVGYSILMAQDETRTHQQWMMVLAEIIRPLAAQREGTIIKLLGDGLLAEFPSALAAVEWARAVQAAISSSQRDGRPVPLVLRIAVHLGDVIDADNDIYGDGVNIAARLQEHAPPGGLILSETVHELVRGSLDVQVRELGLLELRNTGRSIRAFVVEPAEPAISLPFRPERGKLPSIAVLPLENLGGTAADDYFCDGVVEDITLSLAGLRELMVISRGSTLSYRGQQPDPREVGRDLGVRYVMTGTVRRSNQSVRVSAELSDTSSGVSLWAERVEFPPGELFDVQDRIVARIVSGIAPNVRAAELRAAMRKRPENFTAYDCTLRALHVIHSLDVNTFRTARHYLEQAMALDPNFAMPVAWAARWHSLYVGQGWSADAAGDAAKAADLAARAIELDPQNALALATYGHLRSYLFHDYDSALIYFERALVAAPNSSLAWILSSGTLSYIGRTTEAIQHAEHALRLSPSDRSILASVYYVFLCAAHYAHGNYEEAVKWARMAQNENPTYTANYRLFIASLTALDRTTEAEPLVAALMDLEPDFRLGPYERTRQPFKAPLIRSRYMEHLRRAGLPE